MLTPGLYQQPSSPRALAWVPALPHLVFPLQGCWGSDGYLYAKKKKRKKGCQFQSLSTQSKVFFFVVSFGASLYLGLAFQMQ